MAKHFDYSCGSHFQCVLNLSLIHISSKKSDRHYTHNVHRLLLWHVCMYIYVSSESHNYLTSRSKKIINPLLSKNGNAKSYLRTIYFLILLSKRYLSFQYGRICATDITSLRTLAFNPGLASNLVLSFKYAM